MAAFLKRHALRNISRLDKRPRKPGQSFDVRFQTSRDSASATNDSQIAFSGAIGRVIPTLETSRSVQDDKSSIRQSIPTSLGSRFGSARAQHVSKDKAIESRRGPLGLRLLVTSPEPLIEIIFVHGLRGGSVKTWQKGTDPRLFWPQYWLPYEPEFGNVSIHSFGYDSDWRDSESSALGLHDFGQALYEEMRSSPHLRRNPKSSIILVGHSMGGLVIKRAYALSQQDGTDTDISTRIRCVFFLATPHRGSDYAKILSNILKISEVAGLKTHHDYVHELTTGSKVSQLINQEFIKHADNLFIYSFYETRPSKIGFFSGIVVEKSSAILGVGREKERVTYLNATHGNVCKFEDIQDPNYITIKNSLGAVIQVLLNEANAKSMLDLKAPKAFLGVPGYVSDHHDKLEGSCRWIEARKDFQEWIDSPGCLDKSLKSTPFIYWITANPGVGKTTLAGHVALLLQQSGLQCATYHFHVGKHESQTVSGLLRSIAYQMAECNAAVREVLMRLSDNASTLDLDDARAIWHRVFTTSIFQISTTSPQYWIIDAIDECVKYTDLFSLLKCTLTDFPLKIFITSRRLADMAKLVRQLDGTSTYVVEIPVQNTIQDIELYIGSRMVELHVDAEEQKDELKKQLISNSDGSFLWVRLVIDELEGVYGYEAMLKALRSMPKGMSSYYKRAITEMAGHKHEMHVAKAILLWVALAARPLAASELSEALELDVKTRFSSLKSAIEGLCGHLVLIDTENNSVRLVHTTAREFLCSEEAEDFRCLPAEGHERIALACLQLLSGREMQPPRHRRVLGQVLSRKQPTGLLEYAIFHFSEHVFRASEKSVGLLAALGKFVASTSMTWIEKIARNGTMHHLIRTARNLKAFSNRRSNLNLPSNRHSIAIEGWAMDLGRLAVKFWHALAACPHSIYFILPPLFPVQSVIHRQRSRLPDSLYFQGLDQEEWDDCIATLSFAEKASTTVCCGHELIAVGFQSGEICLYNHKTYDAELVLHGELYVDLIRLGPQKNFIVASNRKFIILWDIQGGQRWKTRVRSRCILLSSFPNLIVAITQQGKMLELDIESGDLLSEKKYVYQSPDGVKGGKAPFAASLSPGMDILALAYRNSQVCLFDTQSSELIGWAIDSSSRAPEQLLFNPNPDINLLLVAYNESHLALYDSWSGMLVHEKHSDEHIILESVTCSSSGHTFATVDVRGSLCIWDFESLTILYHVLVPKQPFRILHFTPDGFNLLDVTKAEMKIWSPATLVRKTIEEEASTSDQPEVMTITEGQFEDIKSSRITASAIHPSSPEIFVGKHNGDVSVYSAVTGQLIATLYSHQRQINNIAACKSDVVASSDFYNDVQIWEVSLSSSGASKERRLRWQHRFASFVCQLLLDQFGNHLLVSTANDDYVYRTDTGDLVGSISWDSKERTIWKWLLMADNDEDQYFALIHDHELSIYSIPVFPKTTGYGTMKLDHRIKDKFVPIGINHAVFDYSTRLLIIETSQQSGFLQSSSFSAFVLPRIEEVPASEVAGIQLIPKDDEFRHFLGLSSDNRIVFLTKSSWVCSVPIEPHTTQQYARHFFVPLDFINTTSRVLPTQATGDSYVFFLQDKLSIIRNGLNFEELQIAGESKP